MTAYGGEEDEHAGEQFYTENIRIFIHAFFNEKFTGSLGLKWLVDEHPLDEQIKLYTNFCRQNLDNITAYYNRCMDISNSLTDDIKQLFDATLLLQASIHYYCTRGVIAFGNGYEKYQNDNLKEAFITFGDSANEFYTADELMRNSEYGVWESFYFNECFADIKHTAYMLEKMMGYVRERGDNARHDKWYRDAVYEPADRRILTLLVDDNHMTDKELYNAFKKRDNK